MERDHQAMHGTKQSESNLAIRQTNDEHPLAQWLRHVADNLDQIYVRTQDSRSGCWGTSSLTELHLDVEPQPRLTAQRRRSITSQTSCMNPGQRVMMNSSSIEPSWKCPASRNLACRLFWAPDLKELSDGTSCFYFC
ncbi:MAG: hypothetical protein H0X39_11565 [Actinobacteria bacterium]|nr:hypothetical protein [Actinomycetota bacterium]